MKFKSKQVVKNLEKNHLFLYAFSYDILILIREKIMGL